MSDEREPPELRDLIPGLTKPSITDAEQRQLYEAAMRGEHPPLQMPWVVIDETDGAVLIQCPGCGAEKCTWVGRRATCDGCGVTRRVP